MQAVALHPEVIVARSVKWQTSCTVLHHGDETFVVDSVIYPSELELLPADGHTQDGMAVWSPAHRILCCGDYLSPVEIPWLQEHGNRDAYVATLRRLQPYVEQADWIVPGHGEHLDAQRALAILREDLAYLEALPAEDAPLPLARRDRRQKEIHADNVQHVRGAGGPPAP